MSGSETKTVVGVPFYDGEGVEVLSACLTNLDQCLNRLNIDAQVIVGINGPRVSMGKLPLSYEINKSDYNADIRFIKTRPGLVAAEKAICSVASEQGYKRVFLTDADISRFPNALVHMWKAGDQAVIGANYATYPIEILAASGIKLTSEEELLMKIFEADKHPLAREFTWSHRPRKRLKGSLLLVDIDRVSTMFGNQNITSDSRMNDNVPEADKQLVNEAAFMHYGRVCLTDHIQARLRHYRAAAAEGYLDAFTKKSIFYSHRTADSIAQDILAKYPYATQVASNFLLQCALRHQVAVICRAASSGKQLPQNSNPDLGEIDLSAEIHTYEQATKKIAGLLQQTHLQYFDQAVISGKTVTQQDQPRAPIDLGPFLQSPEYHTLMLRSLGLENTVEV